MKKWMMRSLVLLFVLGCCFGTNFYSAAASYNYGEAMQKAIYFFECQQSGKLPAWNRVEWRGPSGLNDYVQGGWYDAGDNVKFGLPMSYSAGMLAWAVYEYREGFETAGQWEALSNNLRFVLDYLVRCHQGNQLVYQIGNVSADHGWWGPAELVEEKMERPYYTTNASCMTGDTAATLALGYLVFKDSTYLEHAKALFAIADATKSDAGYTASDGYYPSRSGFWDELIWAGCWLYLATDDATYLQKAESYVPNLKKQGYTTDAPIEYQWAHCWDDKKDGALLLLARITGKQLYVEAIERHLDWWTCGYNGERVTYTPGGLAWLDTWGSLRYAADTAFLALVYGDWVKDAAKKERYHDFAKKQINYILGDNPRNSSYVVGFGHNPPQHPHHRTAHGSWCALINVPDHHRHTIYGALVGGPSASDTFTDSIDEYTYTEVACDYNAGLVACLAKMVQWYGGTSVANFPPPETREDELFTQAIANSSYGPYTELRLQINNRSGWPARVCDRLSCRYYVDLSEVFASGLTLQNVYAKTSSPLAKVSPLQQYEGNVYYVVIDFTGTKIYPGGMNDYCKEIQFQIGLTTGSTSSWDATNDFSCQGLSSMNFTTAKNIPVYDNGALVFGKGPGPELSPAPSVSAIPSPTPSETPVPSPTPTPSPSRSPSPSPSQHPSPTPSTSTGCSVTYTTSDWGGGGSVNITIKNNGTTAINGWELAFRFPGNQKITNLWCGKYTQSGAAVTITNEAYNSVIPVGGSVNLGFGITFSGTNAKPSSFTVNGVPAGI